MSQVYSVHTRQAKMRYLYISHVDCLQTSTHHALRQVYIKGAKSLSFIDVLRKGYETTRLQHCSVKTIIGLPHCLVL